MKSTAFVDSTTIFAWAVVCADRFSTLNHVISSWFDCGLSKRSQTKIKCLARVSDVQLRSMVEFGVPHVVCHTRLVLRESKSHNHVPHA